ncbi:SPOR domain-containing protein [Acetobacter sp.]|uniref:SPOR domain-containing protein n=1 Tax=Acetobacter sp. TaxID=440 RepID=UPI0039EBDD9A
MTVNDAPPPDPHEDRLSRARERMATDYDDDLSTPRKGRKGFALASLLPADKTTRLLTFGAAGLGALLLVGIGGWKLIGHHQGGIPVFGPPAEPIREKPLDPGGMEVNDMMPGPVETEQQGNTKLAPAPEQPNPAALAARYGAAAKDEAPETSKEDVAPAGAAADKAAPQTGADENGAGPVAGSALPATEDTTPPPASAAKGADSVIEEPAANEPALEKEAEKPAAPVKVRKQPAAATEKAETSAPAEHVAATGGPYGVQLAALNSEDAARKEWDRLKAVSPALFAAHTPVIEKTVHTNAIFYRLRTRGFDSIASARAFCDGLREHGHACNVLRP